MQLSKTNDIGPHVEHLAAYQAWKNYALDCYPNEAVGAFQGDRFIPFTNAALDPKDNFVIRPDELAKAGVLDGIIHSHVFEREDQPKTTREDAMIPGHPLEGRKLAVPSRTDMEQQIISGVPWGISAVTRDSVQRPIFWGDTLPIRPLVGRDFVHGIMDCYSLIRDHFRIKGVQLPDFPRDHKWWDDGGNLYEKGFEVAGFKRVDASTIQENDVFLTKVRSDKLNHGGVYIGNGLLIHHLMGMLSSRQLAGRWQSRLDFIIRHEAFA